MIASTHSCWKTLICASAIAGSAACSADRSFLDSALPDARDAARDVVADTHDAAPDLSIDVPMDTSDAGIDAANDVFDARADVTMDAMPDTLDAAVDVSLDARADVVRDVLADIPMDAGPSGRCTPTIDGTIGRDWPASAIVESNTVESNWSSNELRALRVCYDTSNLYLGIDGTSEMMNGIVVYIDRDFVSAGGMATGISIFSSLTDNTGALDDRISAAFTISVPGFGAEAAWGSAGPQSLMPDATSDWVGLRLFWPAGGTPDRRADFAWISGAHSVCSGTGAMNVCEVAIAWTSLFDGMPRPMSTTVALFVRINNGDGTMSSNQTLPLDNPDNPRTVSRVLRLEVR